MGPLPWTSAALCSQPATWPTQPVPSQGVALPRKYKSNIISQCPPKPPSPQKHPTYGAVPSLPLLPVLFVCICPDTDVVYSIWGLIFHWKHCWGEKGVICLWNLSSSRNCLLFEFFLTAPQSQHFLKWQPQQQNEEKRGGGQRDSKYETLRLIK